jgi:hypothetical protein
MSHQDPDSETSPPPDQPAAAPDGRTLPQAARRALAEAAERRAAHERQRSGQPKEVGGPQGPEPTRYGDWEINGLTSDF